MTISLSLAAGLLGLAAGPSLHHLAVQTGAKSAMTGLRPRCPECGAPRSWSRWHRRTCAACGVTGRRMETAMSLAAGALFAGTAALTGAGPLLPAMLVFAAVTLVLVVTDLDHKIIPNRVLYPGGALAAAVLALGALAEDRAADLLRGLAGGVGYFTVLLVVALVARGGFGFGDVKLGALLGLFTAFESLQVLLLAVFFTGLYGGIPAIALLLLRRAGRHDELPYGPAMVLGAWTALFAGQAFLDWYR